MATDTDQPVDVPRSVARDIPLQVVRGFAMGSADIVPGVSGGTVALLLGIYTRLIANIRLGAGSLSKLLRGNVSGFVDALKAVDWLFLVPLLGGVALALASLSHLIETLLHDEPQKMAGIFFGLVVASVLVAWRLVEARDVGRILIMLTVAVAAFLLLGLQAGPLADPPAPAWFLAGSIAICAMILPGISGSFLLLMMGMYAPLLAAVNDRDVALLAIFMAGAVVGLASFSTVLSYALSRWYDTLMAALLGLMLGSLRVLWPWPNGVGSVSEDGTEVISGTALGMPEGDVVGPVLLALAAFATVIIVSRLAERNTARD